MVFMEALYESRMARYLDKYPKYRSVLLWFIATVSCTIFLMIIFPAVAIDEELNKDGGAKSIYTTFGRMNWAAYSTQVSMTGGAEVTVNFHLSLVGFAMHTAVKSVFYNSDEYQYALWSNCNPANHTEIIVHEREAPVMTDDTASGNSTSNSTAMSWHRQLVEQDAADAVCAGAKDDCMDAFRSIEGLIGVILFFGVAGAGLSCYRLYQPSSKATHFVNTVMWLLVMIFTAVIIGCFNKDCVVSVEAVDRSRTSQLPPGSTTSASQKPGDIYNIFVAIAVLSALVFVISALVFPTQAKKRPEESGIAPANAATGAKAPTPAPVAPAQAPAAAVKNPIADPDSEL